MRAQRCPHALTLTMRGVDGITALAMFAANHFTASRLKSKKEKGIIARGRATISANANICSEKKIISMG